MNFGWNCNLDQLAVKKILKCVQRFVDIVNIFSKSVYVKFPNVGLDTLIEIFIVRCEIMLEYWIIYRSIIDILWWHLFVVQDFEIDDTGEVIWYST